MSDAERSSFGGYLIRQRTLRVQTDWLRGLQLDRNAAAAVRLSPAGEDEGIIFVRRDLPNLEEIPCCPAHLQSMPRWTALAAGDNWVHHTEHVLAALAFARVDNVRVEMDCDRLPMLPGGSCRPLVEAIRAAGLVEQAVPRKVYTLKGPTFLMDRQSTAGEVQEAPTLENGRYILGAPASSFGVTTVFHWPHLPELPIGVAEFDDGDGELGPDLLGARSYLVGAEKEQVRDVSGPVQEQVMHLYPGCPQGLAIEAARHKIVDFVGDMMVLGRPLRGRFLACRAGHRIHHDLVRRLIKEGLVETELC